jgi:hypothetical protein
MFAVFGDVKQFLTLLNDFSWEFYRWLKRLENTAKNIESVDAVQASGGFTSRKKISLCGRASGRTGGRERGAQSDK